MFGVRGRTREVVGITRSVPVFGRSHSYGLSPQGVKPTPCHQNTTNLTLPPPMTIPGILMVAPACFHHNTENDLKSRPAAFLPTDRSLSVRYREDKKFPSRYWFSESPHVYINNREPRGFCSEVNGRCPLAGHGHKRANSASKTFLGPSQDLFYTGRRKLTGRERDSVRDASGRETEETAELSPATSWGDRNFDRYLTQHPEDVRYIPESWQTVTCCVSPRLRHVTSPVPRQGDDVRSSVQPVCGMSVTRCDCPWPGEEWSFPCALIQDCYATQFRGQGTTPAKDAISSNGLPLNKTTFCLRANGGRPPKRFSTKRAGLGDNGPSVGIASVSRYCLSQDGFCPLSIAFPPLYVPDWARTGEAGFCPKGAVCDNLFRLFYPEIVAATAVVCVMWRRDGRSSDPHQQQQAFRSTYADRAGNRSDRETAKTVGFKKTCLDRNDASSSDLKGAGSSKGKCLVLRISSYRLKQEQQKSAVKGRGSQHRKFVARRWGHHRV
ncbi:hypothetical protein Bbelb_184360 [Branchiostoma belcheri]|nr:hypothetical protein Bbelb_184360 [Branchiostoma belcheri]